MQLSFALVAVAVAVLRSALQEALEERLLLDHFVRPEEVREVQVVMTELMEEGEDKEVSAGAVGAQ